jgi:hypothetical protein
LIEDLMFNKYGGQLESSSPNSFGSVKIEIGETFSATLDNPPVFAGYDTDNSFLIYNGYKPLMMELNYRDPNWYNTTPIKLPKRKKDIKLLEGDIELLSFPSLINFIDFVGTSNAKQILATVYNANGTVNYTTIITLSSIPALTGTAYWNVDINQLEILDGGYIEYVVQWQDSTTLAFFNSEAITIRRAICNPKQGRYRLRWTNNDDGDEYGNFTLASDKITQVQKGKRILSDGIDYTAFTFATLSNINNPNITEVGNKVTNLRTLRTDYLNQEELNALEDLYKSNAVLMFDPDNNLLPVIVRDTTFTITDVRNDLVKVEVLVEIANIER